MSFIHYQNNQAYAEDVSLHDIAQEFGTPCYVYSQQTIEKNFQSFALPLQQSFNNHLICYAVKANSNLSLLKLLGNLDSGFDIVSGGELARVLAAGGNPQKIVFSGVGKQRQEMREALLADIYCFNIESESELERLNEIAKDLNKTAAIALRVNPNIDAETHPYIATGLRNNKFGIDINQIKPLYQRIKTLSHIKLIGIACHIGSQLTKIEPFQDVMECLRELYLELTAAGAQIEHLNMGGGLGVRYQNENPPTPEQYVAALKKIFQSYPIKIIIEPGRSVIANAGLLLTRIEYIKKTPTKNFAIIDAAMNDYIRPALYQAWQDIIPIKNDQEVNIKKYDIVGPVCESADCFGQDRELRINPGDLLAILTTGAYGASMSSNYNSRPYIAEILVDNNQVKLIKKRETIQEMLFREESCLS
jgi:diaminopimelate decarboxylase